MDEMFQDILKYCNENNYKFEEIEEIKKAYNYACEIHKGMKRKNGEEYIVHPLTVAKIVSELNADSTTIISALIHEVIEHGSSSFEEIENIFGLEVRNIVESLTRINRLHLTDEKESSSLYLRKVLVALSEDVRVIILKLAGRLHNMRTSDALPKELQHNKALETWNVLIPIAHRLGINSIKAELEDLCFKILKPDIYVEIENSLPEARKDLEIMLDNMKEDIVELLYSNGLKFEIKGRVKSVSSIHNKLSNGKKWKEIYDILGLRIICETESDCYLIIGLIHSIYRPIPKRFKDYIAVPKGNSYQSLHTGIFGENGYPVEVQVRTKEMNEIAEHGVASHWSYKEKNSKNIQNVMEQKLQMFRNIIESNSNDITDDDMFINDVSDELLKKSIYVFTPKGDVVELPSSSTPIDFAYRIHSKVGDTTVGAIVNDVMVPLNYELKDNDIVKIMTNSNSTPNKDWLNFAKTTAAKTKIKAFFSKQDKEEYIIRGKELLLNELKKQHIPVIDALTDEHINKLLSDLKVGSLEEIYLNIGSLRYTPIYIVNLMYEDKKNVADLLLDKVMNNKSISKTNYKNDIIVQGCDDLLVNLASCCTPVFGDDIIGYITKGQGITVHKKDCVNMRDVHDRLIDVTWNIKDHDDPELNKNYVCKLSILTNGINNNLLEIVTKSTVRNVSISSINEIVRSNNIYYDLIVKVKNKEDLDNFISDVNSISFVVSIKRF